MSNTTTKINGIYNESMLAWTAGIIDGEGSILLVVHKKGETPSPRIDVTNTSLELINKLKSLYGGTIVKKKSYKSNHKQCYVWSLRFNNAIQLMTLILPHLVIPVKKFRAQHIVSNYKKVIKRNGKYNDQQVKELNNFINKFYSLS